jgi:hypothetical protein
MRRHSKNRCSVLILLVNWSQDEWPLMVSWLVPWWASVVLSTINERWYRCLELFLVIWGQQGLTVLAPPSNTTWIGLSLKWGQQGLTLLAPTRWHLHWILERGLSLEWGQQGLTLLAPARWHLHWILEIQLIVVYQLECLVANEPLHYDWLIAFKQWSQMNHCTTIDCSWTQCSSRNFNCNPLSNKTQQN